jgi:hypothetical protein
VRIRTPSSAATTESWTLARSAGGALPRSSTCMGCRRYNGSLILERGSAMTSIQPELWIESPREALAFYEAAFGATVLHRVGEGDDLVVQLGVGEAAFWVAPPSATMKRLSPRSIDGATSRAARDRRPGDDRPTGCGRWRRGILARERGARLAARQDHRSVRPRVGDRRATWTLASELDRTSRSARRGYQIPGRRRQ